jgi:hypothetical protein
MEDKQSIKKVLESQGDVHEKVMNNPIQNCQVRVQLGVHDRLIFKLTSRLHTASVLETVFGVARKDTEITIPMEPVSCPTKIGVIHNHLNSTNFQNRFWCCTTILARWTVYPVGVH